jgi:hypothetical protein
LGGVLGVPPARTVSGDVLLGASIEGESLGRLDRDLGALGPASVDWVYALVGERRHSVALIRASASPNVESEPSPISRALP